MDQNFWQDFVISSKKRHNLYDICFLQASESETVKDLSKNQTNTILSSAVEKDMVEKIKTEMKRREEIVANQKLMDNVKLLMNEEKNYCSDSFEAYEEESHESNILKEYVKKPILFIPGTKLMFSGLNESNQSPKFVKNIFNWFSKAEPLKS